MLSQQESWVLPIFHSSQVFCSDPTVKSFLLREGEGTGTQLPLLALLNSLESIREFLGPTTTTQPRHQPFLCHGSTRDPKTPLQSSDTAQGWNSPTFYQLLFSTVVVTKISHRKVHRFHLNEKYPILEEKLKIFVSEQCRRSDGTRTTHVPTETITNWEPGAKGSAGKNFPLRNILLPLQRIPSNWSSLLKDQKLFPKQRQKGLIQSRKPEPGVPAWGWGRDSMGSGKAGIPNPTDSAALQEHHFDRNLGLKGAFNLRITKRGVWDFQEASRGLGLRFCGVKTQQKPCIWWLKGLSQPQWSQEDFPDFLSRCSRELRLPGGNWGF